MCSVTMLLLVLHAQAWDGTQTLSFSVQILYSLKQLHPKRLFFSCLGTGCQARHSAISTTNIILVTGLLLMCSNLPCLPGACSHVVWNSLSGWSDHKWQLWVCHLALCINICLERPALIGSHFPALYANDTSVEQTDTRFLHVHLQDAC